MASVQQCKRDAVLLTDIEIKCLAREQLMISARKTARHGLTQLEWQLNDEIIAYAKEYGVESELPHMASYAWFLR